VLGFVHRQKDPQASCTLPERSSPSSTADQDRAWCRIEHARATDSSLSCYPCNSPSCCRNTSTAHGLSHRASSG
jgi:hypothetical protein